MRQTAVPHVSSPSESVERIFLCYTSSASSQADSLKRITLYYTGEGREGAAVLPVPCNGRRAQAGYGQGAVGARGMHAMDPRGHRGGRFPHGARVTHQIHPKGALGPALRHLQVRPSLPCSFLYTLPCIAS